MTKRIDGFSRKNKKILMLIPVFNEDENLDRLFYTIEGKWDFAISAVDDGSNDESRAILQERLHGEIIQHPKNEGYGASIIDGMKYAVKNEYDYLLTFDSDLQHDVRYLQPFLAMAGQADIISGSRYLKDSPRLTQAPTFRELGNLYYRELIREFVGYQLTDVWCGMKLYSVKAIKRLKLTSRGFAMPLELWPNAWSAGLSVLEVPVPLIYYDRDFKRDKDPERISREGYDFFATFVRALKSRVETLKIKDRTFEILRSPKYDFSAQQSLVIEEIINRVVAEG